MYGRLFRGNDQRHPTPSGTFHLRTLIALALLGAPAMAAAQAGPGSSCRVIATGIDFGQYSALDPFPNLSLTRIIVDCRGSPDFPTRVTINTGSSGNPNRRVMRLGNQELEYNLFVDPGRRRVAGDGSGGTVPLIPRLRSAGRNVFLLFGAIRPQQPAMAGDYSDRIRVDLEF